MSKLLKLKTQKILVLKEKQFVHSYEFLPIFQILIF